MPFWAVNSRRSSAAVKLVPIEIEADVRLGPEGSLSVRFGSTAVAAPPDRAVAGVPPAVRDGGVTTTLKVVVAVPPSLLVAVMVTGPPMATFDSL